MEDWQIGAIYPYKEVLITYIIVRYFSMQYVNYRQLQKTLVTELPQEVAELGTTYEHFLLSQAYATDKLYPCLEDVRDAVPVDHDLPAVPAAGDQRARVYLGVPGTRVRGGRGVAAGVQTRLRLHPHPPLHRQGLHGPPRGLRNGNHRQEAQTRLAHSQGLPRGARHRRRHDGCLHAARALRLPAHRGGRRRLLLLLPPPLHPPLHHCLRAGLPLRHHPLQPIQTRLRPRTPLPNRQPRPQGPLPRRGDQDQGERGVRRARGGVQGDRYEALHCGVRVTAGPADDAGGGGGDLPRDGALVPRALAEDAAADPDPKHRHLLPLQLLPQQSADLPLLRLPPQVRNPPLTQVFIATALFYELHSPIIAVFSLLTLIVKRYFEFQSDSYAVRLGYGRELKQSLIKLYKDSAPKIRPDLLYAWVNYSHPSLWERIENIDLLLEREEARMREWLRREQ